MSEYFDILNPDGTPTGKIKERNAVHHDGDLHGSVHIWLFRDSKVLLQNAEMTRNPFHLAMMPLAQDIFPQVKHQ